MDVLVVLPTFNEARNLDRVVTGIVAQGAGVLVVDDASPDGTGALADDLAARFPAVAVLHRSRKEGIGPAYADGFRVALDAGAGVIVQMDADGSHDPADLPRLVAAIDAGADLAVGSRFVAGGGFDGVPPTRRALSQLGNLYARMALGLRLRDATAGFRAYRPGTLRRLDPASATALGYAFQIEMAWRATRMGANIVEVPVTFRNRMAGASKLRPRIVGEAWSMVTWWAVQRVVAAVRDRLRRS